MECKDNNLDENISEEIKLLKDDNYFKNDSEFNLDLCLIRLESIYSDFKNNISPFNYLSALWELTHYFKECGKCLSWAADDVRAKINIIRNNFIKEFPNCSTLQILMEEERKLGIHICNSENGLKIGLKEQDKYFKYESGCRTLLRLTYFTDFIYHVIYNVTQTKFSLSKSMSLAYEKALAPYHGFFLRNGAYIAMKLIFKDKSQLHKRFVCIGHKEQLNENTHIKETRFLLILQEINNFFFKYFKERDMLSLP